MIYLDNAATTMKKPDEVVEAVARAMTSFGGVGRGVHPASVAAGMAVFEARDAVAALLGAPGADRVAFAANATGALNIAGRGVHPASVAAGMAVFEARDAVAALLGAPGADRVAFAANATGALNIAIDGLLPDGAKAVTTAASHNSVLRPLNKARDERGCALEVVPVDARGALDYEALERAVRGASLVAVARLITRRSNGRFGVRRLWRSRMLPT